MWIDNGGLLQEEGLLKLGIRHFCSTKGCGDMVLAHSRRELLRKSGMDGNSLVTAEQVHGNTVSLVNPDDAGKKIPKTDGLLIKVRNLPVGIFTADCVPLFIADRKGTMAALVHAGWKGLSKGIVENAMGHFDKKDTLAAMGPHICGECYTVGEPLYEIFPDSYGNGRVSLSGEIKKRLMSLGVPEENIKTTGDCTCHDRDRFYSYRRGDLKSRMLSVIVL